MILKLLHAVLLVRTQVLVRLNPLPTWFDGLIADWTPIFFWLPGFGSLRNDWSLLQVRTVTDSRIGWRSYH